MSYRYKVAILGFSSFERSTFESFFRLAAKRIPAYDYVEADADADYVLADADRIEVASQVRRERLAARTLFIGKRPVAGALGAVTPQLQRPINPMAILKRLDELSMGARASPQP